MKSVLVDSDIILDALLRRPLFYLPAINIIELAHLKEIKIYVSSIAFINAHYFLKKAFPLDCLTTLKKFRSVITLINVGDEFIDQALASNFSDFEDAVQYFAALSANADYIITRNLKDYQQSTIPVLTAEQFLRTLA